MAGTSLLPVCRRLEGKVALITGGASGIGECTAKLFSNHGAKVVIADIQDNLGQSLIQKLGSSESTYVHCDVTNEDHIRDAVDKAIETNGKLDIMFNNAGIVDDPSKPSIIDQRKAEFERIISVNVTGVFLGMKHAARVMIPARSGCIISTASVASAIGGCATYGYTCSKHAVVGLTSNLAVELGKYGIRVNCLSPSTVQTPLSTSFIGLTGAEFENHIGLMSNLKGIICRPDDVAKAALYLASDDGQCVSGQNLFIDGGQTIFNASCNIYA